MNNKYKKLLRNNIDSLLKSNTNDCTGWHCNDKKCPKKYEEDNILCKECLEDYNNALIGVPHV